LRYTHMMSFVRQAIFFYIAMGASGVVWLWLNGADLAVLYINTNEWMRDVALGIGIGLATVALWRLAELNLSAARRLSARLAAALPSLHLVDVVLLAASSALGEEILFRGAIQSAWGPEIATVIFGILHGMFDRRFILWMLFATLAGAVFSIMTVFAGNIVPAALAHALINGINLRRLVRNSS